MKLRLSLFVFAALMLFGFTERAFAQDDEAGARQRIAARQGEVAALKTSGAVGENNRGLLEVRDGGGEAATVVAAENRDREVVYAALAKQTGATPEQVGRRRAQQIASQSAPGLWLQRGDGTWYKK